MPDPHNAHNNPHYLAKLNAPQRLRSKNKRVRLLLTPCYYCGGHSETEDHLIPIAKGGSNIAINRVASCFRCNQLKGHLSEFEFVNLVLSLPPNDPNYGILRQALIDKARRNGTLQVSPPSAA